MRILWFLLGCLLAAPTTVWAASDVVATYTYADGNRVYTYADGNRVTLCTRDADHVRMDTSATSFMLLKGDAVYAVNRDDQGGWHAMDMARMQSAGGGMMSMFGGGSAPEYSVRYEKTGRTETVAGYKGTVYTAVVYEDGKVVSREEIVLGAQPEIRKLNEAWMAMADRLNNMGQGFADAVEEARRTGSGGLLRYGKQMRLSKLQVVGLKSAYYDLPKGAQQVQATVPNPGNDAGLADDAKEIGQDAKDTTKDEIKQGVRGLIGNIFN